MASLPNPTPDAALPAVHDWRPGPRLLFGPGALARIGAAVRAAGGARVLLVTDPGVRAAGHAEPALRALAEAGIPAAVFDQVGENPTTEHAEACRDAARAAGADAFVGLGGGSALDAAKGGNFLLTNGGRMQDYWGYGKALRTLLPMIAVPTTAGTGSDAQSFALIADAGTHQKMACGDPSALPRVAILDPLLTATVPRRVAAMAGIDAVAHAVESAATRTRNPLSARLSRASWELLAPAFPRHCEDPADVAARGEMLLGAHWAGAAIEASMLGAAHAATNPLTARHGVPHGAAVGLLLPHVVRFNAVAAAAAYADLVGGPLVTAGERLAEILAEFLRCAGLPGTLAKAGVVAPDFPALAAEAAGQWTAGHNPRPALAADFAALYQAAAG